ncbi:hypothetical protein SAMN05421636_105264 [Pricia antarctica]|uniref:Probable inorganic carbon transporter subunit DabA n=1 Tax=Pricia antarctica TaxID=641691 RepID=A0A1G7DE53_9FLAO|nr:DUF2309 domain-containing protein [Pricia antarctica]SDE49276.1 hypothetical protein SAMN05421636_105264 [Pricia antarctica]
MISQHVLKSIDAASKVIGKTWPLYSFVTSNPLSGYEKLSFPEAVEYAKAHLNAHVFPKTHVYREAFANGEIDVQVLEGLLKENGYSETPEVYLRKMNASDGRGEKNENHALDRIMVKWLSSFLDEGLAEWQMPGKEKGFYKAWRALAVYDDELGVNMSSEIPKNSSEVLSNVLSEYPEQEYTKICTYHLAALPGWTGYINYRREADSLWQREYPISLEDYLGVRLWIARKINAQIVPKINAARREGDMAKLQYIWLQAWEKSWQNTFVKTLGKASLKSDFSTNGATFSDAQLVFCIDTRSEAIRRHVEAKGNYETFGYAGFFGIAMDYANPNDGTVRKSCPPIVASAYTVSESPQSGKKEDVSVYERKNEIRKFGQYFLKRMKNMLPSAFGFVEGSGFYYGLSLLARTFTPGALYRVKAKNTSSYESLHEPEINAAKVQEDAVSGISLDEKVAIVKSAFDLTGWKKFAPLVLFVGHGSHSANNAFGSSLDCGACAATPGRHNARMFAKLANLQEVRMVLADKYNLRIPADTVFIGAEHNTTTDEIEVFDSEVPDSHRERLQKVKLHLANAQQTATRERLGEGHNGVTLAQGKANNWSETRPEWGLAKNAGFIVAPRALTKNENLDGHCFLHSYNWEMDVEGKALEGIMQGPMVVTQWINNHYYFSTVDNDKFGGGSKITHNITGKFGVVQGNGGDLKIGLPLQSVNRCDDGMYHRPLRLSVLIQAPLDRVADILSRNENLKALLDNEWIYLMVMDPKQKNNIKQYRKNMEWLIISGEGMDGKIHSKTFKVETVNEGVG